MPQSKANWLDGAEFFFIGGSLSAKLGLMLTVNDRHTFALRRLAEHRENTPQEQLDEILDAWLALDLEAVDALGQVAEIEHGENMGKALDACITEGHAATMKRAGSG